MIIPVASTRKAKDIKSLELIWPNFAVRPRNSNNINHIQPVTKGSLTKKVESHQISFVANGYLRLPLI